jgi:hypothetical protein
MQMHVRLQLYFLRNSKTAKTIKAVTEQGLTYLTVNGLISLAETVKQLEKQNVPGALIEAGCASGGSAITIASAKSKQRPFFVYDVFGVIPPPSDRDGEDVKKKIQRNRKRQI